MTVRKTFQGAWEVSSIINGYLVTRQYIGYTRKEAIQMFLKEEVPS